MKVQTFVLALLATLASETAASPSYPIRQCANDKCQKAVFKGPANCPTASADAKRDCSSFLATTISPCPATKTATQTKTATAKSVTRTSYATVTSVSIATRTNLATAVETDLVSVTDTVTSLHTDFITQTTVITVTAQATITDPVIVTETITVTDAGTTSNAVTTTLVPFKERGYSACPATQTATKIPSYASCSGRAAYSSACACLGVTGRTSTLPAKTATTTTTKTVTVTPTSTVKATTTIPKLSTQSIVVTVTRTTAITSTIAVTANLFATVTNVASQTETQVLTETDLVTSTQDVTVVVTPTAVPQSVPCRLQAVGGHLDGYYMHWTGDKYTSLQLVPDYASGDNWFLTAQQQLYHDGDDLLAYAAFGYNSLILVLTQDDLSSPGFSDGRALTCVFVADVISCSNGDRNNQFLVDSSGSMLFFGSASDASPQDQQLVTFQRVCSNPAGEQAQ